MVEAAGLFVKAEWAGGMVLLALQWYLLINRLGLSICAAICFVSEGARALFICC